MPGARLLDEVTTAYHAWHRAPISQRDWDDAHLINAAVDVHADDPEFGYRLIADALIHAMGFQVGENRVQRLCSLQASLEHYQARRVRQEGRSHRARRPREPGLPPTRST